MFPGIISPATIEKGSGWLLLAHGPDRRRYQCLGHRIGTAEVESALVSHPAVAEAAVIGFPHEIKGQASMPSCR